MGGFTIEGQPEDRTTGLPERFRILAPDAPPEAQARMAATINTLVENLAGAVGREHPNREVWMKRLRDMAQAHLVEGRPLTREVTDALEDTRSIVHFSLERFAQAPFLVTHAPGTTEISVSRRHGTAPPSADQMAFLEELQQAEHFLLSLYRPSLGVSAPSREEQIVWRRLAQAGKLGLEDARPNLSIARSGLRAIMRDAIRDRAPAYRQAYLTRLWQSYLLALLGTAAALLVFHWFAHHEHHLGAACVHWPGGRCWTLPGEFRVTGTRMLFFLASLASLAFGAWLSASARLDTNSPEVLTAMLSEAQANPTLARAVMVLGFGAVALILLHTGLVVVQIGADAAAVFDSKAALRELPTCLLIGVFLGLGERALPGVVNQRATAFVAGLGGAGAPPSR